MNAPAVVEMIGLAGFSTVCLDAEHAAFTIGDLEALLRAADVQGIDALVRVPETGIEISRVLDAGASGVLVPRVESADQAARAVSLARYPSEGSRGAGPGRVAGYGARLAETLGSANASVAVLAQVETRAGLERAAEIAATPGLDAVFVGPGDLSVSLGVPMGSLEHRAAVTRIIEAAADQAQRTGIFVSDPTEIGTYRDMGVSFFLVQSDSMFLLSAAREAHKVAAADHNATQETQS
ncbi:MAG: aldolase/citrate lyase family protein [Actinomycetia bacterium]|nr:aldolase/citrate lyase family protein [Actinomycetes bacterium]